MRPQRLSGRKERYSCGLASTCVAQEVCVCVLEVSHMLESNFSHAALYKQQTKLCLLYAVLLLHEHKLLYQLPNCSSFCPEVIVSFF